MIVCLFDSSYFVSFFQCFASFTSCELRYIFNSLKVGNEGRKEGNILFNDAPSMCYLRLYDVKHIVKDLSDSDRGNALLTHGLLFPIGCKGYFISIIPQRGTLLLRSYISLLERNEKRLLFQTSVTGHPVFHKYVNCL